MAADSEYSYGGLTQGSTGSELGKENCKYVVVPYDNYEVVVCLTEGNRFIGIAELRIRKGFLSPGQRVASSGYLDVDEFYKD